MELNERGEKVWEANLPGASCCQGLPDGHRLVGTNTGEVIEYDAEGKVTWSLQGLQTPVREVQRLDCGNTLVALGYGKQAKLVEFRPDRSVCWELALPYFSGGLERLETGNTLAAVIPPHNPSHPRGRLVELNRWGEVVWEVREVGIPSSVRRLENGNTLYCDTARFQWAVHEVDRGGKVLWSHRDFIPLGAERLANGHTLLISYDIVTSGKLEAIDAAGKVVWEYPEKGVIHLSAY
jgi:outer membrane protein assembly factor BamB